MSNFTLSKNLDTYQQKLRHTTNLRLLAFFIWKFIIMTICVLIFSFILKIHFIKNLNWNFYLGFNPCNLYLGKFFFLKIYFISSILDWLKMIYYQKYEESFSKSDYFFKLFFFPGFNTIFFFSNFLLSNMFLALFEYGFHIDEYRKKNLIVFK